MTGPGLEPRPFWNCTRCSTIELSGPLGYRNVTGFPIPSFLSLFLSSFHSIFCLSRVPLATSSVSCVLLTAPRSVIPVPVFLFGLRLLCDLASLVPLTVAFPALSATRPTCHIVLIRSLPMSLFSTRSLFGHPASLPLSVSLPLHLFLVFCLILESFFSF